MFAPDTEDTAWLSALAGRGWAVLTADQRIRYNSIEREALLAARLHTFVLTSASLTGEEAGEIFVSALRQIARLCRTHAGRAFIARVSRGPDVRILFGPR